MRSFRHVEFLVLAVSAGLILGTACNGELGSDRCPPGTTYDEPLDRCLLDSENSNQPIVDDAGIGDADAPPYNGGNSGNGENPDADSGGGDDAGTSDTTSPVDTGSADTDSSDSGTPADPCDGVLCASNATCDNGICHCDDGYHGDPDVECFSISACGEDGCGDGQWCDQGQCLCKWGFTADGNGCSRNPVSDPALHTQEQVCAAWNEVPASALGIEKWLDEPQQECDLGVLHPDYHNSAMTKVNVYRWMIGMEAVDSDDYMRQATQACATLHAAEGGGLDHYPDEDTACYTPEGYDGAASSNLAGSSFSGATAISAIDQWLNSVGHRRWMLNPRLQNTAFGSHGGYVCLYVTNTGFSSSFDFYAYPSPGYFPRSAILGQWMVTSSGWGLHGEVDIEVIRQSDGESLIVQTGTYYGADSARPASLTFQPAGVESGETYQVIFSNLNGSQEERSYEVTLIDCQ